MNEINFNDVPKDETWEIPKEVINYYMRIGYREKGIPLNISTCKEIFDILKMENRNEQMETI